jgi:phage repressor protein C with HTH and peptisase S24 domain
MPESFSSNMLSHADIWQAIDRLALTNNLSTSGLAKLAGLDATTFNKSKRLSGSGKKRWPSTESLAKVLDATETNLEDFIALIRPGITNTAAEENGVDHRIPILGYAQAGGEGYFTDAGYPTGRGWDLLEFPNLGDPNTYALEVSGDSMRPLYRHGDVLIISPKSNIRKGDRVVMRTHDGQVMAKELSHDRANAITLSSHNPDFPDKKIPRDQVDWIARILWVSQ